MRLEIPPEVQAFTKTLLQLLREHRQPTDRVVFYGGCIRDHLLGGSVNDYDLLTGINTGLIKRLFDKHGIYYEVNVKPNDPHLYIPCGKHLVQLQESNSHLPDYTINGLKARAEDLEIQACEECIRDINEHRLRIVSKDVRSFYRGIYMIYRYPKLKFTEETRRVLESFDLSKERLKAFLKRKQIPATDFYHICKRERLAHKIPQ